MRIATCVSSLLILTACSREFADAPKTVSTSEQLESQLSIVAGASGTITTLAYYDGGGRHPGINAIDVGAPGGTPVGHQIDYLPPSIAGGWVYVQNLREQGFCSQWWPGSPYYNGAKIAVYTYFYATDGTYLGWHRAAYQHVSPYEPNMDSWWTWNNANADLPAWPSPHLYFGNGYDGGLHLGEVFGVNRWIYNGPGGGLCTTGSHLHQEGDGQRASQRRAGEWVEARYNDLHVFWPNAGWPPIGNPPGDPIGVSAPPPPAPEEPAPLSCDTLGYYGTCDGGTLIWCEGTDMKFYDCGSIGMSCGWENDSVGFNCLR